MKIIVFSDSHGNPEAMDAAMRRHKDAKTVIFCGDGHRDLMTVRSAHKGKTFIAVAGNCDWYCDFPMIEQTELAGKKIIITHGHNFGVKDGTSRIVNFAKSNGADILLFGHTHKQLCTVESGILILNPGSVGYGGHYSVIDIDETTGKIRADEYPDNDFGPIII